MNRYVVVETGNNDAVHGIFDDREQAEWYIREVMPLHIKRGYLMDKTLTADSFEVMEA